MNSETLPLPLNILLADDDADDRTFFYKALTGIPIPTDLTIFHNGEQLMDHLLQNLAQPPDALFLDLSMPRKTGFECLTEMKAHEQLKDIPVIVFTTSYDRGDFEQNLIGTLANMGSLEYIRKPGGIDQLKPIIHSALIKVLEKRSVNRQTTN